MSAEAGDERRRASGPSTAQIVVEILELLDRNTDREHGMPASEIAEQLGVNEKTVRGHLRTLEQLQPFGRRVGRLGRRNLTHAESADPRPGWYIEPIFDTAQMRLLTDGAMLSRSDGEYLGDLIAKIYAFAGRAGQLRGSGFDRLATPRNYNTEFLNNIELLNDAIAHERAITFHYCTYDVDGNLVPRTGRDGRPREYRADPYDLRYKNNKYYLICHMQPYKDLSYLHVERFRDLKVSDADHSITRPLDDFSATPGEPFDLTRHLNERAYPINGPAVPIHMRITGPLEPLYDWFDDVRVSRIDDADDGRPRYDVRLVACERATLWWALQYSETGVIEILAPRSLRRMLHDVGARLAETYDDDPAQYATPMTSAAPTASGTSDTCGTSSEARGTSDTMSSSR